MQFRLLIRTGYAVLVKFIVAAVELAPGEWGGYHSMGYVLGAMGRIEEGLQAARMAIDADPLSFLPLHGLRVSLTRQRRYDAAI